MVIVSHDREFLDQLCTKIVETEFGVATTYKVCALAGCLNVCIQSEAFAWAVRCCCCLAAPLQLWLIAAWHFWTVSLCAAGQLHCIHPCQRGKHCCSMGCLGEAAKGSGTPGAEERHCSLAGRTGIMSALHLI